MRKSFLLFLSVLAFIVFMPIGVFAEEITNIEITGFNEPVIGQKPKFSAIVSDNVNYNVYLEAWMGDNSTMLESKYNPSIKNEIDSFEDGVSYTYSIYIKPKTGYTFADNFTANIDGITLDNYRFAGNTLIFEYEYGVPRDVDFKISNVIMPLVDQEPVYSGEVPEDANYKLYDEIWYDSNGNILNGKFKSGETYTYYAFIVPGNGVTFELPLYATVNGKSMNYESNEGNMYVFSYKYKIDDNYTVIFDANGGKFNSGKNLITIEDWKIGYEKSIEKPKRDGFEFAGYFTEKTGGTSLDMYIAESGIDQDMIFYAQWKDEISNPDTSDNIIKSIVMVTISLVGMISTAFYLKRKEDLS